MGGKHVLWLDLGCQLSLLRTRLIKGYRMKAFIQNFGKFYRFWLGKSKEKRKSDGRDTMATTTIGREILYIEAEFA